MNSLAARLVVAASLVLLAFFVLTGLAIDQAYRQAAEEALEDRLQAYVYTLIAATSQPAIDEGPRLDNALPLPALFTPGARLYGEVDRSDGSLVWLSPSAQGRTLPAPRALARAEQRFFQRDWAGGRLAIFSVGVAWADEAPVYVFSVAEDLSAQAETVAGFRHLIWGWLGAAALALLLAQLVVLRWGLAPLRRITADLARIETGRHERLEGVYPRELRPLTDNLNRLLATERERQRRYRHSLDDLAHSLKTPLALMRAALEARDDETSLRQTCEAEIERMTEIVDYRLRQAAGTGQRVLTAPCNVAAIARRVVEALDKVHAARAVDCRVECSPGLVYQADESDLMEILGNVLDNAYRWARRRVKVVIEALPAGEGKGARGLRLYVDDDGPGIEAEARQHVLERGVTHEGGQGHGIGLAVVRDIVALYGGRIRFETSPSGGLRLVIELASIGGARP